MLVKTNHQPRWRGTLAMVALAALLVGCGTDTQGRGITETTTMSTSGIGTVTAAPGTSDLPGTGEPPTSDGPSTSAPVTTTSTFLPPTGPPGPDATAILWYTAGPGYYCNTSGTLVPQLVVYSDYTALSVNGGIGAYCEGMPVISTGWVAPSTVDSLLQSFRDEQLAGLRLSMDNVMDAGTAFITVVNPAGGRDVASAYGLGIDGASADQLRPRAAMSEFIRVLRDGFQPTGVWSPDRLVVQETFGSEAQGSGTQESGATPTWKYGPTGRSCQSVPDSDVPAVLKAHGDRKAAAMWKVAGKDQGLAIGVVLPGFTPCGAV